MAPLRPLMRGIHPPRSFSSPGGRASPYALVLAALVVASTFLLAVIAFDVFSLPVFAPAVVTGGSEANSGGVSHITRPRGRCDLR